MYFEPVNGEIRRPRLSDWAGWYDVKTTRVSLFFSFLDRTRLEQDSSDTRMNRYSGKRRRQMEEISHHPLIWPAAQPSDDVTVPSEEEARDGATAFTSHFFHPFCPHVNGMNVDFRRRWQTHTHTNTHTQMRLCVAEAVGLNSSSDLQKWDISQRTAAASESSPSSSPQEQSLDKSSSRTAAQRPRRRSWFSRAGARRERPT